MKKRQEKNNLNCSFADGGEYDVFELESNMPLIVQYAKWLVERTSTQRYTGYHNLTNVLVGYCTFMIV
jgi:hypothetical protein